jgi:hypothetical protein
MPRARKTVCRRVAGSRRDGGGDETDYGLNFCLLTQVLQVAVGSY